MTKLLTSLTVDEFEQRFDDGEDMSDFIDWSKSRHLDRPPQTIGLDLPAWMAERLDAEAIRTGVSIESLIKVWLSDRLSR